MVCFSAGTSHDQNHVIPAKGLNWDIGQELIQIFLQHVLHDAGHMTHLWPHNPVSWQRFRLLMQKCQCSEIICYCSPNKYITSVEMNQ